MWLSAASQLFKICREIWVNSHEFSWARRSRTSDRYWPRFFSNCGSSRYHEPFPCFYSRAYPDVHVITRYSWEDNLKHLILSLIVPNVIFAISISVLSYWYCPCCDKACRRTTRVYAEKYPDKEEWVISIQFSYIYSHSKTIESFHQLSPILLFICFDHDFTVWYVYVDMP